MSKATGSPDLNSILKKEIKMTLPKIHPLMKKFIAGYLTIFTLLVGTLVGVQLMDQSQDIRRGAISNGVVLSLNPSTDSVNLNQNFTVDVMLTNPRTYSVSAADIRLTYPTNLLELVSISKGSYFATSNMQRPAPTNTRGWDNVGMQLYSDPANARYAVGALCDYCYLGSSSSTYPEIPACGTITPTCYPKNSNSQTVNNILATYTFRAIGSGTATINFNRASDGAGDIHTKVAVTTLDTNALDDSVGTTTTVKSITIAAPVTSPTPGPSPTPIAGSPISNLVVNDGRNWQIKSNLAVGNVQYTDRTYTLTSIPSNLLGHYWISTANDSRGYTGDTLATFTAASNITVYVAHNTTITTKPSWLSSANGWTQTANSITNLDFENQPRTFTLFTKNFTQGSTVSLGQNGNTTESMYTVIVTPTSTTPTACDADIDQSGRVDGTDYAILKSNYFSTSPTNPRADIDKSGRVDGTDYAILKSYYFQTCQW